MILARPTEVSQLYEPVCDRVEVVRTVDQFASVAEDLVRTQA